MCSLAVARFAVGTCAVIIDLCYTACNTIKTTVCRMLNRTKLIHELQQLSHKLFVSYASEHTIAEKTWDRIASDVTFIHKIKQANVPWPLPTWQGKLNEVYTINPISSYCAMAVDGSQIFPDRHQGTGCFLINIGSVAIEYGSSMSTAQFDSVPHVFSGEQFDAELPNSPELVTCLRQEYELASGIALAKKQSASDVPCLLLYDGSLIFWHLAGNDTVFKNHFFPRHLALLEQLYALKAVTAWYISMPKSKELLGLIRCALCEGDAESSDAYKLVDHVIDATIAHYFLQPGQRSTIFQSTSSLCQEYPPHLQPYFLYMHAGDEMGRVELPAWIACNEQLVDTIVAVIADQCTKGRGYPVVLSEAHEQAVVKGPDRDFFYQLIVQQGIKQKQRLITSQKSLKKRGLGI